MTLARIFGQTQRRPPQLALTLLAICGCTIGSATLAWCEDAAKALRGVSLTDIASYEKGPTKTSGIAAIAKAALASLKQAGTDEGSAASFQGYSDGHLIVDIEDNVAGHVVVRRIQLDVGKASKGAVKISSQHEVAKFPVDKMHPDMTVSLADRFAVLHDPASDHYRSWPIEASAIDKVRFPGRTTVMTPEEDDAVISIHHATAHRDKPYYYRNEPFINVMMPKYDEHGKKTRKADGSVVYDDSAGIGFHIYQNKTFARAFDSHGCMRFRRDDLRELYSLLKDAKTITTHVKIHALAGFRHPFPLDDSHYEAVQGFGANDEARRDYLPEEYRKMLEQFRREGRVDTSAFTPLTAISPVRVTGEKRTVHEQDIEDLQGVSVKDVARVERAEPNVGPAGVGKITGHGRKPAE